MRKFKILSLLMAAVSITFLVLADISPGAMAATDPEIQAKAALLMETGTGRVLYAENENDRLEPASLTKIMTALLAVEAIESGDVNEKDLVTASETCWYDVTDDSSNANIQPGEIMTLEDLLYCTLVSSACEACNVIAEYISGDVSVFIEKMNERAEGLGCTGTHFSNTHGLPDPDLYTTARDISLIFSEAEQHALFREITGTVTYAVPATNLSEARLLTTTNRLMVDTSGYYYNYCTGGKTGSTSAAGYCLAATATKGNLSFISVVMGTDSIVAEDNTTKVLSFSETKRLFEWGFDSFRYLTIVSPGDLVAQVPVAMGDGADVVVLHPSEPITALLDNEITAEDFSREITIYSEVTGEELVAPVKRGEILGEMALYLDGVSYGSVDLVANTNVALLQVEYLKSLIGKSLGSPLGKIIIAFILIIIALYIFFVVRYNKARKKKRRDIEETKRRLAGERKQKITTGKSFEDIYEMRGSKK